MKLTVTHFVPSESNRPHAINGACWCFPSLSITKEFEVGLSHFADKGKDPADFIRVEQEIEL